MCLRSGIIYLKEFNMKSLCIWIIRTCSISWQFMFWIDAKLSGHCLCFNFSLSSHIVLGASKGKLMHCLVIFTSCLKKEMQLMSNNVMSFSSLNIFNFRRYQPFWVQQDHWVVFRNYWWPQLWKYVKEFVKSCDVCARSKNLHHRPHGLL